MKFKNIILITVGSFIVAFALYHFHYQSILSEGGILGLFLLLKHVFDISPAITSAILDTTMFLIGLKVLGKHFFAYTIISIASFSLSYKFIEQFPPLFYLSNLWLVSILGGIFVGLGVGLVIISGGACGSDDVIALIINKYFKIPIKMVYYIDDFLVLVLSLLIYMPFQQFIFSLLSTFISTNVINLIIKHQHRIYKETIRIH